MTISLANSPFKYPFKSLPGGGGGKGGKAKASPEPSDFKEPWWEMEDEAENVEASEKRSWSV